MQGQTGLKPITNPNATANPLNLKRGIIQVNSIRTNNGPSAKLIQQKQ